MPFKRNCSYRGNTRGGGALCRGLLEAGKGGSGNGASLSMRALRGDSERYVKEGSDNGASLCLHWYSVRGTYRGSSFTGDSQRHIKAGCGKPASLPL